MLFVPPPELLLGTMLEELGVSPPELDDGVTTTELELTSISLLLEEQEKVNAATSETFTTNKIDLLIANSPSD